MSVLLFYTVRIPQLIYFVGFFLFLNPVFVDGEADKDVDKDGEDGRDDGADGKFEYVTSSERGSSQVNVYGICDVYDTIYTWYIFCAVYDPVVLKRQR